MVEDNDERRRSRAEQLKGIREQRDFKAVFELRTDADNPNEVVAEILASVTEFPYDIGDPDRGGYVETIARGSFKRSIGNDPPMILLAEHTGLPLASSRGGTMFLEETERGLKATARLDATDPDSDRVIRKIRRGDLTGASFSFRVTNQEWASDGRARRILGVELAHGDISFCAFGANPAASVAMRSKSRDQIVIPDHTSRAREIVAMRRAGSKPRCRRAETTPSPDYYTRRLQELRRGN